MTGIDPCLGILGGLNEDLKDLPAAPASAHSALNSTLGDKAPLSFVPFSISTCKLYSMDRGKLLGAVQPAWTKVLESEARLKWLKTMIERDLVVRNIESYAKAEGDKLRTEEMRLREEERDVLKGLMKVKIKDEKKNLLILQSVRERLRNWIAKKLGKNKKFVRLMQDLRKANNARRIELKNKYNAKLRHLEENRRREVEEKRDRIPNELKEYEDCNVFDREKFEKIEKDKFDVVTLGGLELDEEEKEVLRLNPKFAALKKLDKEECERDVEVGLMKIRLEVKRREKYKLENDVEYTDADGKKRKIDCEEFDEEKEDLDDALERQVYDPVTKTFDYSRKRTTDLPENGQVYLPKAVNAKVESEMSIIRNIILEEFETYKEEIDK